MKPRFSRRFVRCSLPQNYLCVVHLTRQKWNQLNTNYPRTVAPKAHSQSAVAANSIHPNKSVSRASVFKKHQPRHCLPPHPHCTRSKVAHEASASENMSKHKLSSVKNDKKATKSPGNLSNRKHVLSTLWSYVAAVDVKHFRHLPNPH